MSIKNNLPYFLCSATVADYFPGIRKSIPFNSGYTHDAKERYYVLQIDFEWLDRVYKEMIEAPTLDDDTPDLDFWASECVPGIMDVSKITLASARRLGLFVAIERQAGLSSTRNRAMVIRGMADKYNCDPIQLMAKIKRAWKPIIPTHRIPKEG